MRTNVVRLIGNLGKDPEVKRFDSGAVLTELTLATNERWQDKKTGEWKDSTEWHDLKIWKAVEGLSKGDRIAIEGKLKYEKWEDKDGNKRTKAVVEFFSWEKLVRPEKKNQAPTAKVAAPEPELALAGEDDGDDLPF